MTDTKDEITLISSGVTNPAVNRWKYRNIETRRMGLEFEAEQHVGKFRFNQSLTFVDTKVLKSNEEARIFKGDKVPMVPSLKATFRLKIWFFWEINWIFKLYLFSKTRNKRIKRNEDLNKDDIIIKHTIGGHGTLDGGLIYRPDRYF